MNESSKKFNYNEFFDRLFKVADYYNLKRMELLDILDITASYMSMMRSGKVGGSFKMIINIAEYFSKINIRWLLFGEGEMFLQEISGKSAKEPAENSGFNYLEWIQSLPPDRRDPIIEIIKNMIKITDNK